MTLTFQQVEPLNDEHHDKIIAAFDMLFIVGGGEEDSYGDGYGGYGWGDGDGNGYGNGGRHSFPEEWRVE